MSPETFLIGIQNLWGCRCRKAVSEKQARMIWIYLEPVLTRCFSGLIVTACTQLSCDGGFTVDNRQYLLSSRHTNEYDLTTDLVGSQNRLMNTTFKFLYN